MCAIGAWSARAMLGLVAAYVAVFVVGFASVGNLSKPLPDPYLAIAEVLILVMAPIMVALMLAIHACAPCAGQAVHSGRPRMDAGRGGVHDHGSLR
jgi:hypothetical protein